MNVFVRWRPLVGAETTTGSVERSTNTSPSSSLLAVTVHRRQTPSDKPWQSAAAFAAVLDDIASDIVTFAAVVQPTVPRALAGGCCSFFAYGHSGSGKTHTVVGYEQDKSGFGMCLAAVEKLFKQISKVNNDAVENSEPLAIGLCVFELRQKAAFDLLNDGTKCHIRKGPDGKIHVRGETETLSEEKVRVQPIVKRPCWTFAELHDQLRSALARRAVGTSSVHDQSSRTHAVLELEIINLPLIAARTEVIDRQSELVPVGKRALDVMIDEQTKSIYKDDDNIYQPNTDYVINQALIDEVMAEKDKFEARVANAEAKLDAIYAQHNSADSTIRLGGKMIFVDLAGAEYQQDIEMSATAQTPTERQGARQINTDLLALKEVIRAWSTRQKRVPYRSSPLTMVLRETFAAQEWW